MQRSVAATDGIFAILDTPSAIQDSPRRANFATSATVESIFRTSPSAMPGLPSMLLTDLTLQIEPGKSYALVGASGAGKSTILSLILRLYDPTSGAVRIDGNDLRGLTQQSLREQIGLVTQDTFLFHDTIYNNILFGRLDATREEVYARGADGLCARVHPGAAAKIRHPRRRQGNAAFRRTTTTIRHRARGFEKCAYSSSRRSHLRARFRIGKTNSNGVANARRRQDRGRDRPSALHHFVLRPNHRHGSAAA